MISLTPFEIQIAEITSSAEEECSAVYTCLDVNQIQFEDTEAKREGCNIPIDASISVTRKPGNKSQQTSCEHVIEVQPYGRQILLV